MKNKSILLNYNEKVKLGSYYTPMEIVEIVKMYIADYIDENSVLMDNSAGCGAFADAMNNFNIKSIMADIDPLACSFLKKATEVQNILCDNSLLNISRSKYMLKDSDKLIIIGNPPYNDFTSKSKKKLKKDSKLDVDEDVKSRDLGVSFLKSYNKLEANYVCILHPLSYLIKESNFKNLKDFRKNYKLIKGTIFSSSLFYGTKKTSFPILVALYERNEMGMEYEDILNFNFKLKDEKINLLPSRVLTTDKKIRKYPPKKSEIPISDIGVYFYTFRDINSLKTSKSFINVDNEHNNKHVVVNIKDFYKYCYLNVFKDFFEPDYIFGNFSPIYEEEVLKPRNKLIKNCIIYSIRKNKDLIKSLNNSGKKTDILKFYEVSEEEFNLVKLENLENQFKKYFDKLKKEVLTEEKYEF